jgi:hypothetical protein
MPLKVHHFWLPLPPSPNVTVISLEIPLTSTCTFTLARVMLIVLLSCTAC